MIDRRGFLKLLGALGASSLLPVECLLASPEASKPIQLGEGVWWIPEGGKPVRLEVTSWSVGTENEIMPVIDGLNYLQLPGRSSHFAELEFFGQLLDRFQSRGALQMRLKMFGGEQFEFSDCWMTDWSLRVEHDGQPKQTARFQTGLVTRSLWQHQ